MDFCKPISFIDVKVTPSKAQMYTLSLLQVGRYLQNFAAQ